MKSISIAPRKNWQEEVEKLGFTFHTLGNLYWDESKAYQLSMNEVLEIEKATAELHGMCLEAVQHIIDNNLFAKFGLTDEAAAFIINSWNEEHPSIYGRFDLGYNGLGTDSKRLKMLEYNADTPTSLFEAAVVQWHWLKDYCEIIGTEFDQYNSLHEKLIAKFKDIEPYLLGERVLYFSCVKNSIEDLTTVEYLRDCATQAGLETEFIFVEDIGYIHESGEYVDMDEELIDNIFKLYPWEWMNDEPFKVGLNVENENSPFWIEPAWKQIISNKLFLTIMWKLFPGHKLLLPTFEDDSYFVENKLSYVSKPLLGREGNNVTIYNYVDTDYSVTKSGGDYAEQKLIYQLYFEVPEIDGSYPIIGSWMVDQEPAGIGIRENNNRITDNLSRFIPHFIKD